MTNEPLENLREKARDALAHGQYQEARQIYQQALGYRSDHPDLHYGIATVCFVLGDLHSAVYHFKEAIRLDPERAGAYVNLGAVYNRLGLYDEALTALRRGIQLDADRAEGYYNLGLVYKHLGQLDLAVHAYREAVRVNPRMFDAHYNLGNIFFEKEQFAHAIAHYRQALEIRPKWEKARKALDTALADQASRESEKGTSVAPIAAAPGKELDLDRHLDPLNHGKMMKELHNQVVDIDNASVNFLDFLQKETEKAIRELSICILTPNDPRHNLDDQIQKFESVIGQFQQMQDAMHKRMARIRLTSEQIVRI